MFSTPLLRVTEDEGQPLQLPAMRTFTTPLAWSKAT
jgi:hypothetical protein